MGTFNFLDLIKNYKDIEKFFVTPVPIPLEKIGKDLKNQDKTLCAIAGCPVAATKSKIPSDKCLYEAFDATSDKKKQIVVKYFDPLRKTMDKYNIDTVDKRSMFLGQIAHETENLKETEEKTQAIIFVKTQDGTVVGYDKVGGKYRQRKSADLTEIYGKDPITKKVIVKKLGYSLKSGLQATENQLISFENLNGEIIEEHDYREYLNQVRGMVESSKTGDASKAYGAGGLHTTGDKNKAQFIENWNREIDNWNEKKWTENDLASLKKHASVEDIGKDPELIADSAGFYWKTNQLNNYPELNAENLKKISSKINGGTIGEESRIKKTEKIQKILNRPECQFEEEQPTPSVPLAYQSPLV